ncbi:MAG: S8 family serine peptidase [Petrimonas mucosa]|jgi:subtilisin family serine protease|uniref:S8 family peptidase n=1 Tax=Petrimonas mucosa TaxID=1642646 RepID=UPI001767C137|nr:S8 family serine peptidase [Petrimonas mucosa]HHT29780.1 S8 family serine peptidase [Petrimonas mucosa]
MRLPATTLFLLLSIALSAQTTQMQYRFRVYLKDKGNSEVTLSEPEKFLTPKAIERKRRQQVPIDQSDLPISSDYFNQLKSVGAKPVSHSKWFNTIVIQLNDSSRIDAVLQLPFVDSARYVWRGIERNHRYSVRPRLGCMECPDEADPVTPFGITTKQFALHNARQMALSGFTGRGIEIAIIDAGFTNVDVIPQFDEVNIAGFRSFVPEGDIFASSDHGTKVFSTMATNLPGVMIGSAPHATYHLLRSEDVTSEFPVEEDYWVRAVEYADSIGIDLINTSLGYTNFDDSTLNYRHVDLDGKTSLMSLAADKAYEKGMILVTSAGNEGSKEWQKVSPPADAKHALSVGAVGIDSLIAPFSSKGYTADKRLKPDIVSVGKATITIGQNGLIGFTNGTSLSSPFMAGLVASLWSANPNLSRAEVIDIVKRSADRYNRPDSVYGYGIPDFGKALKEVLGSLEPHKKRVVEREFSITRSAKERFEVLLTEAELSPDAYRINLVDESGNLIAEYRFEEGQLTLPVQREVLQKNKYLHFIFMSPFTQKTIRFRL